MKALIVHLSDIHVRSEVDPVLGRGEAIVAAIHGIGWQPDAVVVAVSGDVAFSGTREQLEAGGTLIETVADGLRHGGHSSVSVAAVPGNHDCLFTSDQKLREKIVLSIPSDPDAAADPEQVDVCVRVQQPFFDEFIPAIADEGRVEVDGVDGRLYYEYRIQVGGGGTIRVRCCNTAWLSRLREKQGELFFPASALVPDKGEEDLALTMFHHPYNWLESDNSRAFRKAVESVSDIVLTGHEHDSDRRTVRGKAGERSQYVEGGALQESGDPSRSAFSLLQIDAAEKKQRVISFEWEGTRYDRVSAGTTEWTDYESNQVRRTSSFPLLPAFSEVLEDVGIDLRHPTAGIVRLSDIFVPPDLMDLRLSTKGGAILRSQSLFEKVDELDAALIVGDTQSGRTCLAKWLFRQFHDTGRVPVLLTTPRLRAGGVVNAVERAFKEQYAAEHLEAYRQLPTGRRVVIVDDYHRTACSPSRQDVLDELKSWSDHVILLAHDLAIEVSELLGPTGIAQFEQYRILPFGHLRRDDLIGRWVGLSADDETVETKVQRNDRFHTTLNALFGKNYVPAYPFFILSVLQASDSSATIDLKASTYGYFYELLIRTALAKGGDRVEYDVITSYLGYLAYFLFEESLDEFDETDLRAAHDAFLEHTDVDRPFEQVRDHLIENNVIERYDDVLRFKHRYCYYYFVAAYLRDHITSADAGKVVEVKDHIQRLSRTLAEPESASILLFLSHLSKHPFVIEQMLVAARGYFPGVEPARLDGDLDYVVPSSQAAPDIVYEEEDPESYRRKWFEQIDEYAERGVFAEEPAASPKDLHEGDLALLREQMGAFSTLRILGQILKNFPGSLDGSSKQQIMAACYDLGLRMLSWSLEPLRDGRDQLVGQLAAVLREEEPKASEDVLWDKAEKGISDLVYLIAFGCVRYVSAAVGSKELDRTYQRVLEQEVGTPAASLVQASLAIDHHGSFPWRPLASLAKEFESNPVALTVLRQLVVQRFHLFPAPGRLRQRVCDLLGISFTATRISDPRRNLLPASTSRRKAS